MGPRVWGLVRGSGGSDGQKILRLPTDGVCVGMPGHKDGITLPRLSTMLAVPQSLREVSFKWVPRHRKRSQGHSVFTSGVPNMSGTRLTCKKIDLSRRVFQVGPPSLLLGLMAQTSLEEFQLSAPSPHDVIDTCRLRGRGPQGGPHQVQLKSGWAATQSFSLFRVLPLR